MWDPRRVSTASSRIAPPVGVVAAYGLDGPTVALAGGAICLDAWSQLEGVKIPVTVACGDLDVPFLADRGRELAERLPRGRHRVLAGMAHLPQIEDPAAVAAVVDDALGAG